MNIFTDEKIQAYTAPSNYLLNTKEASAFLGITKESLYNLVSKGCLKANKLGNGPKARLRFVKSDLEKYMGIAHGD